MTAAKKLKFRGLENWINSKYAGVLGSLYVLLVCSTLRVLERLSLAKSAYVLTLDEYDVLLSVMTVAESAWTVEEKRSSGLRIGLETA